MSDYVVHNDLDCEAVIKVIGVGGGGGNAVDYMMQKTIHGVNFININTDAQALKKSNVHQCVQIGYNVTRGLGAGSNPAVGAQVAESEKETIASSLEGADMVFIAAGMGGGTGTGAAPVVAEIARSLGILTVAVVTKPFSFEGIKRTRFAEEGIENLSENVDSLIVIPNDRLLGINNGENEKLMDAFARANNVLFGAVQGIAELITRPGMMNVDFADVRTVMSSTGVSMMGSGEASGPDRAREATLLAIESPLLEDVELTGAQGILVNITCGDDLSINEFAEIGNIIAERASDTATVKIGTVIDKDLDGEMIVTVVATGLSPNNDQIGTNRNRMMPSQDHGTIIQEQDKPRTRIPKFMRKQ